MTPSDHLFEAMLSRCRAGEPEREILADYGYVPEREIDRLRAEVAELRASKETCDNTEAYNVALEEIRKLKAEVERLKADTAEFADLPAKALALLDRLQPQAVEIAGLKQEILVRDEDWHKKLQRAEAVGEERKQLLREAAYLIQFQHDSDADARRWSDKYHEKKAAWEEGTA